MPDINLTEFKKTGVLGLLDRPFTSDPIERWQGYLKLLSGWPKENEIAKQETAHAEAVVAWKKGGEKGPEPQCPIPPLPPAARRAKAAE